MGIEERNVYILYVDNEVLYQNYVETVEKPIKSSHIGKFHDLDDIDELNLSVWGFNPTKDNESIWRMIKRNDIFLFYRNGRYFTKGIVVQKLRSKELSSDLWKNNIAGKGWELLILIKNLENIDIDFNLVMSLLVNPVMPDDYIFPIKKISDHKIEILIQTFGTLEKALENLSKINDMEHDPQLQLDLPIPVKIKFEIKKALANYRIGQNNFRRNVFSNYNNKCAICDIEDIELLEASHIVPINNIEYAGSISNGICFCVLHHTMFDKGYFSFDNEYRVILNLNKKLDRTTLALIPVDRRITNVLIMPSKKILTFHRSRFGWI